MNFESGNDSFVFSVWIGIFIGHWRIFRCAVKLCCRTCLFLAPIIALTNFNPDALHAFSWRFLAVVNANWVMVSELNLPICCLFCNFALERVNNAGCRGVHKWVWILAIDFEYHCLYSLTAENRQGNRAVITHVVFPKDLFLTLLEYICRLPVGKPLRVTFSHNIFSVVLSNSYPDAFGMRMVGMCRD